jgi:transcriptional regulator GlxA family with amidase domain
VRWLSADDGDRSRPILCGWQVVSPTMDPASSSSGVSVQPDARLGDPARFDYIVVVGGSVAAEVSQHGMPLALATEDALVRRCSCFRDAFGRTPLRADRLIRIEQAKHLLATVGGGG